MSEDSENKIKVEHHRGNDFSSHYVTNAVLTGPTGDDLFQIHFFIDTLGIISETGSPVESDEGTYTLAVLKDDLIQFREDKSRISMNKKSLIALRDAIDKHLSQGREEKKD